MGLAIGILIFAVIFAIIALITLIVSVVTRWILFTKTGTPGWYSVIPFFSDYTFAKISTDKKALQIGYTAANVLRWVLGGVALFVIFKVNPSYYSSYYTGTSFSYLTDILTFAINLFTAYICSLLLERFGENKMLAITCLILGELFIVTYLSIKKSVYRTQEQQITPTRSAKFCTNCGSPAGGGSFCTSCGQRIMYDSPAYPQYTTPFMEYK